jgi:hypothetical protein
LIYEIALKSPPEEDFDGAGGTVELIYNHLTGIDGQPTTTRQHIKDIIVNVTRNNDRNLPYLAEGKHEQGNISLKMVHWKCR